MPQPFHLPDPIARSLRSLIPVLAGLAALLLAALFLLRFDDRDLRGDEGTYVAMAASLARDFDLEVEAADRAWAELAEATGVRIEVIR